jgi:predicted outer membrane repeat protein
MKKALLNIIIILTVISGCAERDRFTGINDPGITGLFTEIKGSISGELNLSESPFWVLEDIIVDSGKSLKVNPGVEVYFSEGTRLIVKGELIISGNRSRSVLFSAYNENKKWRGIKIINADKKAVIDFLYIKEVREDSDSLYLNSSVVVFDSEADIFHSIIYQNSALHGGGLGLFNSKARIINNIFRDNFADVFGGAIYADQSDISIINNTFFNNTGYNNCGGVQIYQPIKTELQNNIFYKNQDRNSLSHFVYSSQDSTTLTEEYNYFAFGNMDPIFFDDNYLTLYYLSPCKDAGNPDPAFNDHNGSRNDQGAYGGPSGNW